MQKELGVVDISTNPKASIYINGKKIGETPIVLELPAISHELMIIKGGYRSIKKIIHENYKRLIKQSKK